MNHTLHPFILSFKIWPLMLGTKSTAALYRKTTKTRYAPTYANLSTCRFFHVKPDVQQCLRPVKFSSMKTLGRDAPRSQTMPPTTFGCKDELQSKGEEHSVMESQLASCKDELQSKDEELKSQKKINLAMEFKLASCEDQLSNIRELIRSNVRNENLDEATRNLFGDLLLEMMSGA